MEMAERSVEVAPEFVLSAWAVAYVHLCAGRYEEALSSLEPWRDELRETSTDAQLVFLLGRVGRLEEFGEAVAELEARAGEGLTTWTEVAMAYMGIDDHERALELLARASDQRPPPNNWTAWIGTLPLFEPLRGDPRFGDVLVGLGFRR